MFMQSNGGLTDARLFQGKDSILSGPAGGVVGMVAHGAARRLRQSDRLRHGRHLDRRIALRRRVRAGFETLVAGVRMRAPTSRIHIVLHHKQGSYDQINMPGSPVTRNRRTAQSQGEGRHSRTAPACFVFKPAGVSITMQPKMGRIR
jgi:hypothetical protein